MGSPAIKADRKETGFTTLDYLRAVYIVDRKGTLWFSHAADFHMRPREENVKGDGVQSPVTRHQLVACELERLLQQATNSGASMEECFAHFDPCNMQ